MTRDVQRDPQSMISRRTLVHGLALAAGATVAGAGSALAQQGGAVGPPSVVTTPPRDFSPRGAPTTYFWDPDIIAVDPSFNDLAQPNALKSEATVTVKEVLDNSTMDEFITWYAKEKLQKLQRGSVKGFIAENKTIKPLNVFDKARIDEIEKI